MKPGRLLLIDYHFGNPGATGGFRWNAMARHLLPLGWSFDVVTLAPATATPVEPVPGIRIHGVPAPTTTIDAGLGLAKRLKRSLRGSPAAQPASAPAVPPAPAQAPAAPAAPGSGAAAGPSLYSRLARHLDAARFTSAEWAWTRQAEARGLALAREHRPVAVMVSSPPHLTQLAGAAISRATGIPYVADFRDPWVFGRAEKYDVNVLANPLGRLFEARTLRHASLIIGNTGHARDAVAAIYPGLAARTLAVSNGYDAGAVTDAPDDKTFRIVFAGWLYPFMAYDAVIAAAGRLRRRAGLGPDTLAVEFMGSGEPGGTGSMAALATQHGLDGCLRLLPAAPRAEARRLQSSAAVLVAFDASTQLAMPTKFYDYTQMGGTMLLIGFPDGAMAAAAARLGLRVHTADDAAGLDAALDEALRRWQHGELRPPLDREGIFDRRLRSLQVHEALLALPG